MLPCRTYLHSASSVPAIHINCRVIAVFVFRKPLFTIIIVPKHKSSNAGSASKPKRNRNVLSISEKVKILDMIEIEKKILCRDCQVDGKNEKHDFYRLCSTMMEKHDGGTTVYKGYSVINVLQMVKIKTEGNTMLTRVHPCHLSIFIFQHYP
jgi:hypothetical protein